MQTNTEGSNAMSKELEAMLAAMQKAEEQETEEVTPAPEAAEPEQNDEDMLLGQLDNIVAPAETTEELSAEELAALEMGVTRAEVYQAQESTTSVADPSQKVTKGKAARKAKTASAPKAPRIERDLTALPAEVFARQHNIADPEAEKAAVLANKPVQTKVVEKWENLFISLNAGNDPSKFTNIGFRLLKQKGTMTSSDLVATMKADGAADGTARAQTGQIMALFPLLGIADRAGQVVTLRADSAIADKLSAQLGL